MTAYRRRRSHARHVGMPLDMKSHGDEEEWTKLPSYGLLGFAIGALYVVGHVVVAVAPTVVEWFCGPTP